MLYFVFFFQAEDGIRDIGVTGVQTCALPILVERVRPVGMAGELDGAPDLRVGRLGLDPVELPLKALQLARELRAAQKRHRTEPAEPLPKPQLVLRRGHRTTSGAGRARGGSPAAAGARRIARNGDCARQAR